MDIQEVIFNTKQIKLILIVSIGLFMASVFAQIAFASANIGAEFSIIAGFTLVGLSYGLTRNILVPIFQFIGINTLVIMMRGSTVEVGDYMVWILQALFIAFFVIGVNLIISREKVDIRYYAITGAIAGFIAGLFALVQVF